MAAVGGFLEGSDGAELAGKRIQYWIVEGLRMVDSGSFPPFQLSPSSGLVPVVAELDGAYYRPYYSGSSVFYEIVPTGVDSNLAGELPKMATAEAYRYFRAIAVAAALTTAGCAGMMSTPTEQSIAGLSPSGQVTITEDFVTGLGGGNGTLYFQGQAYQFKVFGSVAGPGGGVSKITASGPLYKLASVADFAGRYTQSTGAAGFSSSGSSDLWLQNNAGVIMHLQGKEKGAMFTLGKEEIFIRMVQQ